MKTKLVGYDEAVPYFEDLLSRLVRPKTINIVDKDLNCILCFDPKGNLTKDSTSRTECINRNAVWEIKKDTQWNY